MGKLIPVNISQGPVNIDTGPLVSVSRSDGHDITTYVLCVSTWRQPRLFWCSICTKTFDPIESSSFQYTRSTVSNGVDPGELADYLIKDEYQPVINPYNLVIDPCQTPPKPTQLLLKQEGNVWVVQTKIAEGIVGLDMPSSLQFDQEEVQLPEPSRSGAGWRRGACDSVAPRLAILHEEVCKFCASTLIRYRDD